MQQASLMLQKVSRIWLGSETQPHAVRMFRRCFSVAKAACVTEARLAIFADARYHVWVNGAYIGRGPAQCHPHRMPAAGYDVAAQLRDGENVIAVLVLHHGIALHSYVPAGTPGVVAALEMEGDGGARERIATDASWKATDVTGWNPDVPRRSWAIGAIEWFDANVYPDGWREPGFDDSRWEKPQVFPPLDVDGRTYRDTGLPTVRASFQPVKALLNRWAAKTPAHSISASDREREYAEQLIQEPWDEPDAVTLSGTLENGGGLVLENLSAEEGAILSFDLGKEYVGGVTFEIDSDTAGSIDIGWSEYLKDGRPWICQFGSSYVDRYEARPGKQEWLPVNFNAGRFIYIALRGFSGAVRLRRIGMMATEPELDWAGSFACSDERVNAIWQLCARTVRVGAQETMMDCPTREQALYVGDGIPNGVWIGRLTGDYSHLRYLLTEALAVQSPEGLTKSSVFSGRNDILLDYSLLAVWGVKVYLDETGDLDTVRELLPACHGVVQWFLDRRNDAGLVAWDWETRSLNDEWVEPPATAQDVVANLGLNLFIDHPGMGWHCPTEPGIDRRGVNAALNALLVFTLRALADAERATGAIEGVWREEADRIATQAQCFWNEEAHAFSDGLREGALLSQISQHTNVWCLMAGVPTEAQAETALDTILDDTCETMARCGPYFWSYLLPLLARHGRMDTALHSVRSLWGRMLDQDATTTFETFAGDDRDSYCHPWSAAPVDFLPRLIAGIGALPRDVALVELTPQYDLLERVDATVMTVRGVVRLQWERVGGQTVLQGTLPEGVNGRLCLRDGTEQAVQGMWRMEVTNAGTA